MLYLNRLFSILCSKYLIKAPAALSGALIQIMVLY